MKLVAQILFFVSAACVCIAIFIKFFTVGKIVPGPMPVNWLKLAETLLLFTIAFILLQRWDK